MDVHVGRFGTLYCFHKEDGRELAVYPIDKEEISIGRDSPNDVRLYISWVSRSHCKIKYEYNDQMWYLEPFAKSGIAVDGKLYMPCAGRGYMLKHGAVMDFGKHVMKLMYPPGGAPRRRPPTPTTTSRRRSYRLSILPIVDVMPPDPEMFPGGSPTKYPIINGLKAAPSPMRPFHIATTLDPDSPESKGSSSHSPLKLSAMVVPVTPPRSNPNAARTDLDFMMVQDEEHLLTMEEVVDAEEAAAPPGGRDRLFQRISAHLDKTKVRGSITAQGFLTPQRNGDVKRIVAVPATLGADLLRPSPQKSPFAMGQLVGTRTSAQRKVEPSLWKAVLVRNSNQHPSPIRRRHWSPEVDEIEDMEVEATDDDTNMPPLPPPSDPSGTFGGEIFLQPAPDQFIMPSGPPPDFSGMSPVYMQHYAAFQNLQPNGDSVQEEDEVVAAVTGAYPPSANMEVYDDQGNLIPNAYANAMAYDDMDVDPEGWNQAKQEWIQPQDWDQAGAMFEAQMAAAMAATMPNAMVGPSQHSTAIDQAFQDYNPGLMYMEQPQTDHMLPSAAPDTNFSFGGQLFAREIAQLAQEQEVGLENADMPEEIVEESPFVSAALVKRLTGPFHTPFQPTKPSTASRFSLGAPVNEPSADFRPRKSLGAPGRVLSSEIPPVEEEMEATNDPVNESAEPDPSAEGAPVNMSSEAISQFQELSQSSSEDILLSLLDAPARDLPAPEVRRTSYAGPATPEDSSLDLAASSSFIAPEGNGDEMDAPFDNLKEKVDVLRRHSLARGAVDPSEEKSEDVQQNLHHGSSTHPSVPQLNTPATPVLQDVFDSEEPSLAGLKHVLARMQAHTATPSFTGVNEMFSQPTHADDIHGALSEQEVDSHVAVSHEMQNQAEEQLPIADLYPNDDHLHEEAEAHTEEHNMAETSHTSLPLPSDVQDVQLELASNPVAASAVVTISEEIAVLPPVNAEHVEEDLPRVTRPTRTRKVPIPRKPVSEEQIEIKSLDPAAEPQDKPKRKGRQPKQAQTTAAESAEQVVSQDAAVAIPEPAMIVEASSAEEVSIGIALEGEGVIVGVVVQDIVVEERVEEPAPKRRGRVPKSAVVKETETVPEEVIDSKPTLRRGKRKAEVISAENNDEPERPTKVTRTVAGRNAQKSSQFVALDAKEDLASATPVNAEPDLSMMAKDNDVEMEPVRPSKPLRRTQAKLTETSQHEVSQPAVADTVMDSLETPGEPAPPKAAVRRGRAKVQKSILTPVVAPVEGVEPTKDTLEVVAVEVEPEVVASDLAEIEKPTRKGRSKAAATEPAKPEVAAPARKITRRTKKAEETSVESAPEPEPPAPQAVVETVPSLRRGRRAAAAPLVEAEPGEARGIKRALQMDDEVDPLDTMLAPEAPVARRELRRGGKGKQAEATTIEEQPSPPKRARLVRSNRADVESPVETAPSLVKPSTRSSATKPATNASRAKRGGKAAAEDIPDDKENSPVPVKLVTAKSRAPRAAARKAEVAEEVEPAPRQLRTRAKK